MAQPRRHLGRLVAGAALAAVSLAPGAASGHRAFRRDDGAVHTTGEVFYNGNSQGGILGGAATAISTEWTRAVSGCRA